MIPDVKHPLIPPRDSDFHDIEPGDSGGTYGAISHADPATPESPPPSYHEIPGTVPAHQGVSRGPPPSYEEAVDPNGKKRLMFQVSIK